MQKRNIEIKYGNTEENSDNSYTFVIPSDKYKDINIKCEKKQSKEKKENKDTMKSKNN